MSACEERRPFEKGAIMHASQEQSQRYTQLTDDLRKELRTLIAALYWVGAIVSFCLVTMLSLFLFGPYPTFVVMPAWVGVLVAGHFAMKWLQRVVLTYLEWRDLGNRQSQRAASPREESPSSYEYIPPSYPVSSRETPPPEPSAYAGYSAQV